MSADRSEGLEDLPLSVAYDRVQRLLQQHRQDPRSGASAQALALLQRCERLVDAAALFSSNEDKDDIATGQLKYLLLPFQRAELLSSAPSTSMAARHEQVWGALGAYCSFLQRCEQYDLLGSCKRSYQAEEEAEQRQEEQQGEGGDGAGSSGAGRATSGVMPRPMLDPESARAAKVERFKRSKALAALVQHLELQQRRDGGAHSDQGAAEEAGVEDGPTGGVGAWDEEDERRLWMVRVEAAVVQALDARPTLRQELALLRHAAQRQGGEGAGASGGGGASTSGREPQAAGGEQPARGAMMGRLSGIADSLAGGGGDRARLRQQVLRPSHTLPTMTVEQQGEIEYREMVERERRQQQAAEKAARARTESGARSDEEENDDAALAKARAWDDYKDAVPFGSGNSKLRPCA